jgi:hypothetical protein
VLVDRVQEVIAEALMPPESTPKRKH